MSKSGGIKAMTVFQMHKGKILIGSVVLLLAVAILWPLKKPVFDKPFATVLLDREGALLGAILAEDEIWRFPTQQGTHLPERFKQALISYEDAHFYRHPGINPVSLLRAAKQNIKEGKVVRGGSTLSMQLARLADGNKERTFLQKFKEMWMALRFELYLGKAGILALYAAHAPFGSNIEGLSAAAWRYFGRAPEALSWGEAATLAVLPNNPAMIYPGKNTSNLKEKRNFLLDKLLLHGHLDSISHLLATLEPIPEQQFHFPKNSQHLLHHLQATEGKAKLNASTIDQYLQNTITEMAVQYSRGLKANQIHNMAVLVIDWQEEEVLSYIGNIESGEGHHKEVDIVQAARAPGSLLKPMLYAHAIDKGIISPWQLLPDVPIFYEGFSPKNFDHKYYGAVGADRALARSLNIPFVNLLRDYGYVPFHQEMRKMGWHHLNKEASHYGLSMILGGAEISLWEAANLYVKLARVAQSKRQSKEVVDIVANPEKERALTAVNLSAGSAYLTLKAMKEVLRPEEETGWEYFGSSQQIAWKTGTSFGFRDAWAVGINQRYVVAVWTGNAEGEGRPGLIGTRTSAPFMFQVFKLLKGGEGDFNMPIQAMKTAKICLQSGYLAGANCIDATNKYVNKGKHLLEACPYHQKVFLNKEGTQRVSSQCYPVADMQEKNYLILPPAIARYYQKYNSHYIEPPLWAEGCHTAQQRSIAMIYPRQSTHIMIPRELGGDKGAAVFEAAHASATAKLFWYLNDEYLGSTKEQHQMEINTSKSGKNRLYLVDQHGEYLSFDFEVVDRG